MDIRHELSRLNPRQHEAVLQTEGPLLILAGAGSGKTRVLTMRTAHLVRTGVAPANILAVTFTNKAAREMKGRVSALLGRKSGEAPVISTFHALCLLILRREIERIGYRKDFTIYDTSDQISLLRGILSDVKFGERSFKPEQVLELISRSKNHHKEARPAPPAGPSGTEDLEAVSEALYPKYSEALKSLNALDFDDLILLTIRLFRDHPDVLGRYQERFRYIMVDEYQDTNRMQYDLVRLLSGERKNLCVVGDDDQSIYAWRGASLSNILDFERDFPGAVVVRLEQNYRSSANILKAANSVIANNRKRMEKALWTEQPEGPAVKLMRAADSESEADWVADRIQRIKYENRLSFEDFSVIYRANIFSRPFEAALRRLRIPYTVVGGMSYFEYREVKDLASYLRIIANPRDDLSLLRIANTPKRGLGPAALGALSEFSRKQGITLLEAFDRPAEVPGLSGRPGEACGELGGLIRKYRERFNGKRGLGQVLSDLNDEIDYRDYICGLYKTPEAAMQRLENIKGFIDSLGHYESSEDSPSLQGFLETLALDDLRQEKDERKGSGVTLTSFHSAKGLEFPVVFIVGAEEGILPHKKSAVGQEGLEEERRLFYVGITRAMKELYITHARQRTRYGRPAPSGPSRFLQELPADAVRDISGGGDDTDGMDEETAAKAFFANIKEMLGD